MTLYALKGRVPALPSDGLCWVAPTAALIGDVRIGREATVWFNAVLRGDNEQITLGAGSNIQDGCICHTDPGFPLEIGTEVTVGHGAILHGCSIGDGSLIGMGAVVLNGARIGRGCLIGAKTLVTEGKDIPDGSMVLGQPGKVVQQLDEAAMKALRAAAQVYRDKLETYAGGLTETAAGGTPN
jgi:carbonic anhydrase/acetyltransferase-like protein (isoleucine patch superfamily)